MSPDRLIVEAIKVAQDLLRQNLPYGCRLCIAGARACALRSFATSSRNDRSALGHPPRPTFKQSVGTSTGLPDGVPQAAVLMLLKLQVSYRFRHLLAQGAVTHFFFDWVRYYAPSSPNGGGGDSRSLCLSSTHPPSRSGTHRSISVRQTSPAAIPAPGVAGPVSRARKRIGSAKAAEA
jgi:hypothetical protein